MDLLKIRQDLHDNGFVVVPFPKQIKASMISYIKSYLQDVVEKRVNFNLQTRALDSDGISSDAILAIPDHEYVQNFSKPFRMYPDHVSQLILTWIKPEFNKLLGVSKVDSNYVSPAERKINQQLHATTHDIFWRCARLNKNDVGPAHCDYQFWELAKGTEDEVPVPFAYRERWKLWVPLMGCGKENSLQVMPSTHKENVPHQLTETAFGQRPCLDPKWYAVNECRFIAPINNIADECIIFHDRLVHRGQKNNISNLRISSELTILVS